MVVNDVDVKINSCQIKIKNLKSGKTNDYLIVAEEEADLKLNKMSIKSPIAKGLLGLKAGEKAKVQVPAGEIEFEVLEVVLVDHSRLRAR
jgi:transcription elongation factor GreA